MRTRTCRSSRRSSIGAPAASSTRRSSRRSERAGGAPARVEHSLDALRARIHDGQPVIVLVPERGNRYHYVVVTGASGDEVVVHDPSWGPSRAMRAADFEQAWRAAGFWSLVILPPARGHSPRSGFAQSATNVEAPDRPPRTRATRSLLQRAWPMIRARGFEHAGRAARPRSRRVPERRRAVERVERRPLRRAALAGCRGAGAIGARARSGRCVRARNARLEPVHARRRGRRAAGVEPDRQAAGESGAHRRSSPHAAADDRRDRSGFTRTCCSTRTPSIARGAG